jgi:hypothetical protein
MRIIELIRKNRHIKLVGNEKLRIERELPSHATGRRWCAMCCAAWASPSSHSSGLPSSLLREAIKIMNIFHMHPLKFPRPVVRGFTPPLKLRDFKLIAFDMDSTLINIECVDEIADAAGRKAEVAAITEAAMRGEIADYKESLRQRVALLTGWPLIARAAMCWR